MVVEPLETTLLQYTPDTPFREQTVSLLPEKDLTQSQVSGTHFSGRKMQYHPVFAGETRTDLMGSLRIEPAHEQVFPREVKTQWG